jgi:hypothetical protein
VALVVFFLVPGPSAGRARCQRTTAHDHADLSRIFQGLAWLVVCGLVIQFYLAGAALFGATTFQPHRALGNGLAAAILLLLVAAVLARGGRLVGLAAVLMALTVVQLLLPSLRSGLPWVAALHVVNAVALAALAVSIACAPRQTAEERSSREAVLASPETR